jgi:ribosomal protein S18 acetylase RimI-like enzyme
MLLGYTGREKAAEDPRTGLVLLRHLGPGLLLRLVPLLRLQGMIGRVGAAAYYISNVAVYPEQRGKGIGGALLQRAEEEARAAGAVEVVLDVETDNHGARRLYERSGYQVQGRTAEVRLAGRAFSFYRMGKPTAPAP